MTSKIEPQFLFFYVLFMATVVTSWTSCREIGRMSGDNDAVPNISNEILRGCHYGWIENSVTEKCECPSPNIVVAQYECRTIEPEDWYSDMGGCLVDQGILFQMEGVIHPDSATSYSQRHVYIELPDTLRSSKLVVNGLLRIVPRGERFDSIQFYVPSFARLPYYKWPTPDSDGYNTGFHGVILNDSTLVGQFVFAPMYDSWRINRNLIFSECEAIIRKGRVE